METNNVSAFIHWKDGEITQTSVFNSVEDIKTAYEPVKNDIDGIECFNLNTYEITPIFY